MPQEKATLRTGRGSEVRFSDDNGSENTKSKVVH